MSRGRFTVIFSTVCFVLLAGVLLMAGSSPVKADTDVGLSVNAVLVMSVTNCDSTNSDKLDLTITPISTNNFVSNCQTIEIGTNAPGYELSIKASGSNPNLNSGAETNALIYQNPTTIVPTPNIPATSNPLSAPNTLSSNTWGFAITSTNITLDTPINNFDNSYTLNDQNGKYSKLPNTETTIYETDELPGQIDNFKFYYGANITSTMLAGLYQTTVTYTAIGNEVPEPPEPLSEPSSDFKTKTSNIVPNFASTITPSGNGSGTNGPQFSIYGSGFGSSPTVTIGGKACTDVVVNSAGTAITCTGPVSGLSDGEQRTFINGSDAGDENTVWYTSYNFPTLQSLTTTGTCDGTAITPVIYRDSRDSQLYYVAKLQDNKCWMLDNLRYKPNGDTSGTVTNNFSATQVANTGAYLTADTTSSTSGTNLDSPKYIDPISSTGGTNYCRTNTNKSPQNITKCGLLYNWYTATAGTAPQSQSTQYSTASGSICPLNWHLPTGMSDFQTLDVAYGGTGATQSPVGLSYATLWQYDGAWRGVFSGVYVNASYTQGAGGYYWSSSVSDAANGYVLNLSSSFVSPGDGYSNRYYGSAIRCVL